MRICFEMKFLGDPGRWRGPIPAFLALRAAGRRQRPGRALRAALASCLPLFLLLALCAVSVCAHPEPVTLVMLDVAPERVTMTLHLPVGELDLAFGQETAGGAEAPPSRWQEQFKSYLLAHLRLTTEGRGWAADVVEWRIDRTPQRAGSAVEEVVAELTLTPPPGVSARRFTLNYDVIMHQVVTHKALVSIRRDWEGGQTAERQIGLIQVNTGDGGIDPLNVDLEGGSRWAGFMGMLRHGMQHIKEGTDHLLFLLALLLPAPLLANGWRWGGFGGSRYCLGRLLKIVTAFTLGHSATLLIGALGWVRLPQQPVEVLIAFSILASAIHAVRPLFPGREAFVAAGFGLVHGLAFATVVSDLRLSAGPLALSLLGFNLGIELMQLFVVAITMPWLALLSLTPLYSRVRVGCAAFAALAALGWMASRMTGQTNLIERAMLTATEFAPMGIFLLALIALPAYVFHTSRRQKETSSAHELIH